MKSKFFVIVAIVALVGFVVSLDYGEVWAQQQGPAEPFDSTKGPLPVEFSTDTLGLPLFGDHMVPYAWDPRQVLWTDPPARPFPIDAFDFCDTLEVDALANGQDALFHKITDPSGRRANLLVSFEHDPFFTLRPARGHIAVYMEIAWGFTFDKWSHTDLDFFGTVLPGPDDTLELDGLEVWGPDLGFDADYYSLIGDPLPDGGVPPVKYSVFCIVPPNTHDQIPYVPHSVIVTAVTNPVLTIPEEDAHHYTGPEEDVDLDALMVWDHDYDHVWNDGDEIIFSIRAAGTWDGGEIVVLPFGGPPRYLFHGRHLWHTPFPVAATFNLNPPTEEVDGIEAFPWYGGCRTPTLTQWGLIILVGLLIASTVFVMLRKRKAVVRA